MLQFAEAHMQVRAARNQVGWFKKQEHRVECELLPIQLKIVNINIVYQDYQSPIRFWQNEAKKCSNFKGPGSTMRG